MSFRIRPCLLLLLPLLLCILCDAAFARPPAFGDIGLEEAIERGRAEGRRVVVYWYTEGSFGDEVMRRLVWTDPGVEAWLGQNAIAVWVDRGRSKIRPGEVVHGVRVQLTTSAVVTPDGEVYQTSRAKDPACLLDWLRWGEAWGKWDGCVDNPKRHASRILYNIDEGFRSIDDHVVELCIDAWTDYPIFAPVSGGVVYDRYHPELLSRLGRYTREFIKDRPGTRERFDALLAAVEARLGGDESIVDRGHWLALKLHVFGDHERVLEWVSQTAAEPGGIDRLGSVVDFIQPLLEHEGRWLLVGDIRDSAVSVPSEPKPLIDHLHMMQYITHTSLPRGTEVGGPGDERRRRPVVITLEIDEVTEHMVLLARNEHEEAAMRLLFAKEVFQHFPEAVDYLIDRASREGLLRPLHLAFLDPDRREHIAYAAHIREQWPDADELMASALAPATEELAGYSMVTITPLGFPYVLMIPERHADPLDDFAFSGMLGVYEFDQINTPEAAGLIRDGDWQALGERYIECCRRLGHTLFERWLDLVDQDASLASGILEFKAATHVALLKCSAEGLAEHELEPFTTHEAARSAMADHLLPLLAEHELFQPMHIEFLDPDDPEHAAWIESIQREP